MPPQIMIDSSRRKAKLFDENNNILPSKKSPVKSQSGEDGDHSIRKVLQKAGETDEAFIDFVEGCLTIDPTQRLTPSTALKHRYLAENLESSNSS